MSYVELRAKSNFSFLTGASHPEELAKTAKEKGLLGFALTDINGVYGIPRAFREARHQGSFKFIVGTELTLLDHSPLTLLCKTKSAYGKLCRLITESKKGLKKGESALKLDFFLNFLAGESGFICLPRPDQSTQLKKLKDHFGKNIYLPLTFYRDGHDKKRIEDLLALSGHLNIPLIATNDVEYHQKSRKIIQDVLISIRENKPLTETGFKLRSNAERYIKTPKQMQALFKDIPQALQLTLEVADQCEFSPSELKYRYPSEWIPPQHSAHSYLEQLVWENAPAIYKGPLNNKVKAQLTHELKLIGELKYADYFLTIYDIVEFARSKNILCQGRGSAANSAVCYVLGITAIDPVQMDLLFERFISAERGEPPDIDIDFEHERREEVIQYIYNKYGRHRAAMVSAVVTYQYRSAFREVCKAFGLSVGTLSAKKVLNNFEELSQNHPQKDSLREKIESIAHDMQGFPRHLSIHSGGFTLSADPMTEIVPIEPARMDNRTIIQWDKYDLDTLGLIKVDVLCLGMLTCLKKTLDLIGMKLHEIPHDDGPTYQMIRSGDTIGTFQIESRAQISMLGRLQPKNFYDLVVEVAIMRPGPIVGKMVHPYLKRRQGIEKVEYPHPTVEKILGRTLGVPLFQEQIMKLAIDLAGFTPGESDKLRKCINAWRTSASIGDMADRLMQGLLRGGMTQEFAEQIFSQIQGFSHYGFPESHAASFALIAYASCYLKKHYPAEFVCSLINSQPMGFYRVDTLLYDASRAGVNTLPVSVMKSNWDSHIESPGNLRLGFHVVKRISKDDAEGLIQEREKRSFSSLGDFVKRSTLKRDVVQRLALAGRFDEWTHSSHDALWGILEYQCLLNDHNPDQLNFFRDTHYLTEMENTEAVFQSPSPFEKIQNDYSAFSLSNHGHPMMELRNKIKTIPKMNTKRARQLAHNSTISLSGLVLVRQKPPTANGVCFSTLEDEFGHMDLVLWGNIYEKYRDVFLNHCFITIDGLLQKDGFTVNTLVSRIRPLWDVKDEKHTPLAIPVDQYFWG